MYHPHRATRPPPLPPPMRTGALGHPEARQPTVRCHHPLLQRLRLAQLARQLRGMLPLCPGPAPARARPSPRRAAGVEEVLRTGGHGARA